MFLGVPSLDLLKGGNAPYNEPESFQNNPTCFPQEKTPFYQLLIVLPSNTLAERHPSSSSVAVKLCLALHPEVSGCNWDIADILCRWWSLSQILWDYVCGVVGFLGGCQWLAFQRFMLYFKLSSHWIGKRFHLKSLRIRKPPAVLKVFLPGWFPGCDFRDDLLRN